MYHYNAWGKPFQKLALNSTYLASPPSLLLTRHSATQSQPDKLAAPTAPTQANATASGWAVRPVDQAKATQS